MYIAAACNLHPHRHEKKQFSAPLKIFSYQKSCPEFIYYELYIILQATSVILSLQEASKLQTYNTNNEFVPLQSLK